VDVERDEQLLDHLRCQDLVDSVHIQTENIVQVKQVVEVLGHHVLELGQRGGGEGAPMPHNVFVQREALVAHEPHQVAKVGHRRAVQHKAQHALVRHYAPGDARALSAHLHDRQTGTPACVPRKTLSVSVRTATRIMLSSWLKNLMASVYNGKSFRCCTHTRARRRGQAPCRSPWSLGRVALRARASL
jgi:hypothetical protein